MVYLPGHHIFHFRDCNRGSHPVLQNKRGITKCTSGVTIVWSRRIWNHIALIIFLITANPVEKPDIIS
jgi:hypothetical protein